MLIYSYYGVDDYARSIYNNEMCSIIKDESNCFENDEIKGEITYRESRYNIFKRVGRLFIEYKEDYKSENTICVDVLSGIRLDINFGQHYGIFIQNSLQFKRNDTIMFWTLAGDTITMELDNKTKPSIKVSGWSNDSKTEFFSISNLSVDYIINKIYEIMVSGDVDKDTLETFNRSFEIIKPCLVLRISELVKNWTEIITIPIKEATKTVLDINKQLEELKKKQEELIEKRNLNLQYLDSINDLVDGIYPNIDDEYGFTKNK